MSQIPENLKYTDDHEWAELKDGLLLVGITDHAQSELGDIVFVELPDIGDIVEKGDSFGTIEAVKTVAELYSPISGEIIEINEELADAAESINEAPYSKGWIVKIKPVDISHIENLLSADQYSALIH
jgi:glycine cleavage system H protein